MPTPSSPILIYDPIGGVPPGTVSNPPVYSQHGTTQLVAGQSYVDVVFGSVQTTDEWVLVECVVLNEIDANPLNIWPGIITDKTAAGFRIQLNGMPDSSNYYLHWAVSGINIAPSPASTYSLTGPTSGGLGVASTFTVALPPSTTLAAPVVVTLSDSGGGGAFTPTFVTLTTGSPTQTFTYTPASYGAKTISTTNSGPLSNPASIVLSVFVTTYTFSGPVAGSVSVPSTNFTVALPVGGVVSGTVTVTPSSGGGGGTFTPTTVGLTTGAPSATFTYTPASSGTKTISVTNNGGLTDPGNISYVASAPFDPTTVAGLKLWLKADSLALTDGAAVGTWPDSSSAGNDFTGGGGGGTFKTNIVNSKPVVRLNGSTNAFGNIASLVPVGTTAYTLSMVIKCASISAAGHYFFGANNGATDAIILRRDGADLNQYQHNGSTYINNVEIGGIVAGAWNYITIDWDGTNIHLWRNGTLKGTAAVTVLANAGVDAAIGFNNISSISFFDGDIAEVVYYNVALSSTDRGNLENFLKTKYGL